MLRTAEDLWNASRVFFARWDLSPSQFNLLNVLYGQAAGLSQSDLSRLLIMHRSNATGLVDRLERRGLVRREDHPGDRRAYRVVLTSDGTRLLDSIYPHYFAAAERVWADTPEPRVTLLLEELQELAHQAAAVAGTEAAVAGLAQESTPRRARRRPGAANPVRLDSDAIKPAVATPSPAGESQELRTSDL